jgi:hypothetical protein
MASIFLPAEVCPVCGVPTTVVRGDHYQHVWCQGGHYDSWQALNGRKLNESDAPIVQQKAKARKHRTEVRRVLT